MFEIKIPTTVKLAHAKGRKEMHGEAKVLALDLSLTWTTHNTALDMFDAELRPALFAAMPRGQTEPELPMSDLAFLKFMQMIYPVKWETEYEGYTLRLDYGRGGDADKILHLCKVKNFQFTPLEGGSVEIHFSVSSAADITGQMVGIFSEYIQQDIVLTLLPPVVVQGDLIDSSAGSGAPGTGPAAEPETPKEKKKSKAVQTATDAFIDQHAPAGGEPAATH